MYVFAGTCLYMRRELGLLVEHEWAWTSDSAGAMTANMEKTEIISGVCWRLTTKPIIAPTDNYDIALLNELGADILLGKGADRDTANVETVFLCDSTNVSVKNATHGLHQLRVSTAGASKSGIVRLCVIPIEALRNCPASQLLTL